MDGFVTDATGSWIEKDPSAVLDYALDWYRGGNGWLAAGDSITTSTWTVSDSALVIDSDSITDGHTTVVWLSGGVVDTNYTVTNQVTTAAGRTDERSFTVKVKQR